MEGQRKVTKAKCGTFDHGTFSILLQICGQSSYHLHCFITALTYCALCRESTTVYEDSLCINLGVYVSNNAHE